MSKKFDAGYVTGLVDARRGINAVRVTDDPEWARGYCAALRVVAAEQAESKAAKAASHIEAAFVAGQATIEEVAAAVDAHAAASLHTQACATAAKRG